jgi:maltose/moltooligosaccharide transporter
LLKHSQAWFTANAKSHLNKGLLFLVISILFSFVIFNYDLRKDLYVLSLGCRSGGLAMLISEQNNSTDNGFVNDFQFMPKNNETVAWVQFFSWFALFSIYGFTLR